MLLGIRYTQSRCSRLICRRAAPDETCCTCRNVWGVSVFRSTLKLWEMWPPLFPPSSLWLEPPILSRTLGGPLAPLEKLCSDHKLGRQRKMNWKKSAFYKQQQQQDPYVPFSINVFKKPHTRLMSGAQESSLPRYSASYFSKMTVIDDGHTTQSSIIWN